MKFKKRSTLLILSLLFAVNTFAQDNADDPATNYQTAQQLVNDNKGADAIPFLEKVIKTQSNYTNAAYSLLGSIYDKSNQPEKAITVYKDGLKAYPQDQNLYFNLGIADFRGKLYADAELAAIEAIKLDPKHTNSQRLYGLVAFHQNKRLNALLAFCSFLLIEPQSPRSEEAYTNMQSILKGGVLKADGTGKLPVADTKEAAADNAIIATTITTAQSKNLTGGALLAYQLKSIFTQAGQASAKKTSKTFFDKFYADYFYKLVQSSNMTTFAQLLSLSGDKAANTKWQQDHAQQVNDLDEWVKSTERAF